MNVIKYKNKQKEWHNATKPFATGVIDTGGKFAAGIIDNGGKFSTGINNTSENWWQNLPPVSLIPVANLPPVSLIPVVNLELQISPRIFAKNSQTVLLVYSGTWGKLIHDSFDMGMIFPSRAA
jgi:hypothetical protein